MLAARAAPPRAWTFEDVETLRDLATGAVAPIELHYSRILHGKKIPFSTAP